MLGRQFLLVLALDLASGARLTPADEPMVVSRHYHGDLFTFEQRTGGCDASFCYNWGGLSAGTLDESPCRCRCEPPFPTYREDIAACVNDVQECHLADFSMGDTQERVPFVFMPERGQLVHPSAEITMSGLAPDDEPVVSPVCVVSGSEVLTRSGWSPINSTFEPPFRLRRDQEKTFLQWVGEGIGAEVIEGRLVLVRLLCKDAGNAQRARFSPCVAFRVAGTQGQAAAAMQETDSGGGSLAVGLSVAAILVLYIAAMAGYLVYRRRKRRTGHQLIEDALMGKGRRTDSSATGRERQSRRKKDDKGDKDDHTDLTQRPVSSLSHGSGGSSEINERLPEDTLSALVDAEREADMLDEDDDMSGASAQLRRRLYFNPAFFDPDQLHDPPPGALEFLAKIREMITIAKLKMQAKQYQPSLPAITEAAEEAEAEAAAEAAEVRSSRGSVDIDRWLETVVRESNSDDGGPLYSDSLPRPRRQKGAAPPPPTLATSPVPSSAAEAAAAVKAAAARAATSPAPRVTTSWKQQARQQRDDGDSDTLVGASGDERRNNASFESDDTLNDLVSEAESKVPKLHSDEDSVYSEVRTAAQRRRAAGADGVYEEINISDRSLSAFSGEYTSVSINGDGTVIRTGGKMTIEVDDPAAAGASDAESEEEVFDPDTLEKRRIRVRKARKVRRNPSFYDDSLERRKRGVNYEERFETTHINVNTVLNTSVESTESVYKRWGSVASGSEANSVYSRINFVSSKQQKHQQEEQQQQEKNGLVVGNLRHSQRNLKTFKDYSTVKFGGRTSLLEQWKKKNDQQRAESVASETAASTLPVTSPVPSLTSPTPAVQSPAPSVAGVLRRHDSSSSSSAKVPVVIAEPTPPIPPKAPTVPPPVLSTPPVPVAVAAAPSPAAGAPPLPPRTHSPQRDRSFLRTLAAPQPAQPPPPPPPPPPSSPPPPRPARGQPPLPPKSVSVAPPPPLPSKTRAPAPPPPVSSPPPPPTTRRYFLGQIDGAADAARRRRNSAGESETNSTSSSLHQDEANSTGSAATDKSEPGSDTLGRHVEARLERHLHRSYSASDVSRSEIESLASSRSSLRSPQRCSPNVLERITECESAIRRGAGAGTGMAIALSLKERQTAAAAAATGAERERPSSIRDKWRRLVEPAPGVGRDDSGYQSTDSAESHRPPPPLATPGGIRKLVKKFDKSDAAEQTAASRTRWVHVAQ